MNLPESPSNPSTTTSLRERARDRLRASAPSLQLAKDPSAALRVLFDLASSPKTAHEALALLHELQVHQVELELQHEELQASRNELELAWDRQQLLRDAAPHAQLLLNADACVLECNATALAFLKVTPAVSVGKPLSHWVAAEDAQRVQTWLHLALQGQTMPSIAFVLRVPGGLNRSVCAVACSNPTAAGLMVSWLAAPAPLV